MDVFDAMIFSFLKKEIYTFIRIMCRVNDECIELLSFVGSILLGFFLNIYRDKKIFSNT